MNDLRRHPAARERGSVYLLSLLVMVILMIAALSLGLITQNEMQIGTNERLHQMVFYAANSGIDIATAKALVVPDLRSMRLDLAQPTELENLNVRNRIDVSPFVPIQTSPCNLCQINEDSPYFKINHAVAVTATRIGWMGDPTEPPQNPTPLAQERVSVLVSFQPWPQDILTGADALTDTNRGGLDKAF